MLNKQIVMNMLKLDDLFVSYGDSRFAELAVFLDLLRSLQFLHQQHHWQVAGSSAYGDHLLFQRLYEGLALEIDSVGEKTAAMGGTELVASRHSLMNMPRFLNAVQDAAGISQTETSSNFMIRKSLLAEKSFISAGEKLMRMLEEKKQLSRGIENLLGGILDAHETNIYLLEQRLKTIT